jgi:hypothetical protein
VLSTVAWPLITITGTSGHVSFIHSITAMPSTSGIRTSETTRS